LIIDDDFLLSQYPTSINWNLDLLGKNGTENKTAYKKLEKEMEKYTSRIRKGRKSKTRNRKKQSNMFLCTRGYFKF